MLVSKSAWDTVVEFCKDVIVLNEVTEKRREEDAHADVFGADSNGCNKNV